tara:strand:- start:2193 stop:3638 length:1446 start_codon:yes stop_codon:yes gene_type:complete
MEPINLNFDNLDPVSIDLNQNSSTPSVNFGSGIELLMNDKKRSSSSDNLKLDLGDLDQLEQEMNELSNTASTNANSNNETKSLSDMTSNLFGMGGFTEPSIHEINNNDNSINDAKLGQATRDSTGNTQTWDGYSKMNDIPASNPSAGSKLNDREKRRKKRMMLKKMEDWYAKGQLNNNSNFSMDSPYDEVEDEYETVMEDKRTKDSIKLQGWWFMTFINSIEYGNAAFNPFDLNLDGWGEQVSEDIDSYEEIFSELHDKYKGGKMAPELSLLLRVGFSAAVLNFSNKALSSAAPAFNDVIKQSPELMKMFTNATVSSMSQQSPGFEFANNLMQDHNNKPKGRPPPAPVNTQEQPPPQRPGMTYTDTPSNRPDIHASRGPMFKEQGVDLNNNFQGVNEPPKRMETPTQRPEMKGPQNSDIDNILSGLKTRNVDIHEQPSGHTNQGDDSMISISSLNEMQNGNLPKRSRRKNKSDKNTITLDI